MRVLFIISILSLQIFAANPDQDLIVDIARERFSMGEVLTEQDIQPDKEWDCVYYNARRGIVPNYNKKRPLFKFQWMDDHFHNHGELKINKFLLTNGNLVGTNSSEYFVVIKKAKENALIAEYIGPQWKAHKSYQSISNKLLYAHAYIYCK